MRARLDRRACRRSIAATSIALGVLTAALPAHAQSAQAQALFDEGNQRMAAGELRRACEAFEASNRLEPRAGTLILLGECRELSHQLASAWTAYRDALARVKDPRKRKVATDRVADLEPRLSRMTVSVSGDAHIDGLTLTYDDKALDPVQWNRALPVDGGDHVIVARAPGHEDWRTIAHLADERTQVTVEVPRLKERSAVSIGPARSTAPAPGAPPELAPSFWTARRKVALGVAGASVVSVIAAIALGTTAESKESDALALCPGATATCDDADRANALLRSGKQWATGANVMLGVAAAAAVGAGVLWFTGAARQEEPARVSLVPNLSTAPGVAVIGRF